MSRNNSHDYTLQDRMLNHENYIAMKSHKHHTLVKAAEILGVSLLDLMPYLASKRMAFDRDKGIELHTILGWKETQWTSSVEWVQTFLQDGIVILQDIFSQELIDILLFHSQDELARRLEDPNHHTIFDDTQDGVRYIERQRFMYDTPLVHILDHPVWTEIAYNILRTEAWAPSQFALLQRPPGSYGMPLHRDGFWYIPEEERYTPRFFASINLTDPSTGDGGLVYIPKSHCLNESGYLPHPIPTWETGDFICLPETTTIRDVIIHNNGLVHGSKANTGNLTSYRLYIEMVPLNERTRFRYQGVDMFDEGVDAKSRADITKLFP